MAIKPRIYARRIRILRYVQKRCMTQEEFAKKMGISGSYLSQLMYQYRNAGVKTCKRFIKCHGKTFEYWFTSEESMIDL